MESIIAVYRALTKQHQANGPIKSYGYAWIKTSSSTKEIIDKCKEKLQEGDTLEHVWTCLWRNAPSVYSHVYGHETPESKSPNLDMALNLRSAHIKPKGPKGSPRRNRVAQEIEDIIANTQKETKKRVKKDKPAKEEKAPYMPYTIEEAPIKRAA